MRYRNTVIASVLAITACFALVVSAAEDLPPVNTTAFHSPAIGYKLSLPAGWIQIPDSALQAYSAVVNRSTTVVIHYDSAFQPQGQSEWFIWPYVMVQVIPYPNGQQPNDSEIAEFLKGMAGFDVTKVVKSNVNPQIAKLLSNGSIGAAQWDAEAKTARVPMQMDVAGAGTMKAICTYHFGRRAVLGVFCYALASDFEDQLPTFRSISDSFQFDPGFEYNDRANGLASRAAHLTDGALDDSGAAGLDGLMFGIMCAIVGGIGWIGKKLTGRNGSSASESHRTTEKDGGVSGRSTSFVFGIVLLAISAWMLVALVSQTVACFRLALDGHEADGNVTAYRLVTTSSAQGQRHEHHHHAISYEGYSGEITLSKKLPVGASVHVVYLDSDPSIFAVVQSDGSILDLIDSKIGTWNLVGALACIPFCAWFGICLVRSALRRRMSTPRPAVA